MIKYILFDLGKVIVDFDHFAIAERLAKTTDKPQDMIRRVIFKSPKEFAFEKGKISPRGFYVYLKDKLSLKLSYEKFVPLWSDIFWPKPGMEPLVKTLSGKYGIGLLSNTNKLHFSHIVRKFRAMDHFDDFFLSYKLGFRKPDKRIYRAVLKKTGLKPGEIVYFDDVPEFVETAKKLGFNAFVMKDAAKFKKDIRHAIRSQRG